MNTIAIKWEELKTRLVDMDRVAVAFSGGVDSTLLLWAAHEALGDRAFAVTAASCAYPQRELDLAADFCAKYAIKQVVFRSNELQNEGFVRNSTDRCYHCKKDLFTQMLQIACENGAQAVVEGSNTDDRGDYRPGRRAIAELGIASPLEQAGLSKEEIRQLLKEKGLPAWDKPSLACLASRIPYGETITIEKLAMVDKAEQLLFDLGFRQARVRHHGELARIEVEEEDLPRLVGEPARAQVIQTFKKIGFAYVSLDLQGYRTGSMNERIV